MSYSSEELMICVIGRLLDDPNVNHVAVGAASPIPGSAALLMRHITNGRLRASIIHGVRNNPFTDGGREIFDCAGQGRIDAFFLSGAQIDGKANINLVATGKTDGRKRRSQITINNRVNIIAVNIDVTMPIARVTANPRTGPEPKI